MAEWRASALKGRAEDCIHGSNCPSERGQGIRLGNAESQEGLARVEPAQAGGPSVAKPLA